VRIQVLYIKGCPNVEPTADLVQSVVASQGLETATEIVEVMTPEDAIRLRFLGSPTVRVDDVDVEVRQPRRGRTLHPLDEGRVYPRHPRTVLQRRT